MYCDFCGAEWHEGNSFCVSCGHPLSYTDGSVQKCRHCGTDLDADSAFCTCCGNPVAHDDEGPAIVAQTAAQAFATSSKPVADHTLVMNKPSSYSPTYSYGNEAPHASTAKQRPIAAIVAGILVACVVIALGTVAVVHVLTPPYMDREISGTAEASGSAAKVGQSLFQSETSAEMSSVSEPDVTQSSAAVQTNARTDNLSSNSPSSPSENSPSNQNVSLSNEQSGLSTLTSSAEITTEEIGANNNSYGVGGSYAVDADGLVTNTTYMFKFRIPDGYYATMLTDNTMQFKGEDFIVTIDAWHNNGETQESRYANARTPLIDVGYETQSSGVFVVSGSDARGHEMYIKEIVMDDRICRMVVDSEIAPCSKICEAAITAFEAEFRLLH